MSGHRARDTADEAGRPDRSSVTNGSNEESTNLGDRALPLAVGFILAFVLSWLLVVGVGYLLNAGGGDPSSPSVAEVPREEGFAQAVSVSGVGSVLRIEHAETLNPSTGDFLLFVWFKLKNPLQDGDRAPFLGKYDEQSKSKAGYALALVGGADGVRPHVFWQNEEGKGRWYAFASTRVQPQEWYLFAVTFRAQRYLGVHVAGYGPRANPEVLGGYDLEGEIIPASKAPFEIGAAGTSKFRGRVGPFGIVQGLDVARDGGKIIKEIARNPEVIPDMVDQSQVAVWGSPRVDQGPAKLDITLGRRPLRQ